ncbi:uncharacterized protein LOC133190485 [Saccostrea echinata]|uniref:uncharacterized protein LOC133190485 n=1 Tax=Saccostrea echinata TaxID=191078 RepID=UPI002A800B1C|nr:uncharacterized protein LOC133190485 [Saccostrea echinata]
MDVKNMQLFLIALVTLCLTFLLQKTSAIECFECNSLYTAQCKDSPGSLMSNPQYYKNCSSESYRCRKIQQEVDKDEVRIIRQCAIANHTELGCFERAGTYKIKMFYCECEGNGCNSAPHTTLSIATVFYFAIGFLLCMVL